MSKVSEEYVSDLALKINVESMGKRILKKIYAECNNKVHALHAPVDKFEDNIYAAKTRRLASIPESKYNEDDVVNKISNFYLDYIKSKDEDYVFAPYVILTFKVAQHIDSDELHIGFYTRFGEIHV